MKQAKWMNQIAVVAGFLVIGAWVLMAEPAGATFIIDTNPGGDKFFLDKSSDVPSFAGNVGGQGVGPVVNVTTSANVDTGSGYANIGPVKDSTLTSLIFTPVNANLFVDFSFRGQLLDAGSVKVTVKDNQGGADEVFTFSGLPANADFSRIGIVAQAGSGETIQSVTIENLGFKSVKQIDFSTANTQPSPVPEPATLLLLGSGLIVVTVWRRMKQRGNV
jgi:PEP-CTERM motif